MSALDSPQRLKQIPVNDVPRDTLFRLEEKLKVADDTIAVSGEYLLIPSTETLSFEIRIAIDILSKRTSEMAYVVLRIRNLIMLVYIAPALSDGEGEAFISGITMATPGRKRNILPSPITAEAVAPVTTRAKTLPKNQLLVLAASYRIILLDNVSLLSMIEKKDVPSISASSSAQNQLVMILTDSMFLREGTRFTLNEQNGQLILEKWGKDEGVMPIDPECELAVCILEDNRQ